MRSATLLEKMIRELSEATSLVEGEIKSFWVVTKPTPHSVLADICFETNPHDFVYQIHGGLSRDEIVGFYAGKSEATAVANKLLATRK